MRRFLGALAVALLCTGIFFGSAAMRGGAASPAAHAIALPTAPGPHSLSWHGTIPASGTRPTSDCNSVAPGRADELRVVLAARATVTFSIAWTPISKDEASNDEVLTVVGPRGPVGSSDTSHTTEKVVAEDLAPGTYRVLACGDVNMVSQGYSGTLKISAE